MHNKCSKLLHKLHFFNLNMGTTIAHDGVCYLIKERSIEINIPGQDGDFEYYTGFLAVSSSITAHIYNTQMSLLLGIHNCNGQPSFVNFQCVLRT